MDLPLITLALFLLVLLASFVALVVLPLFPILALPPASEKVDPPERPSGLLPSEIKHQNENTSPTLALFRRDSFPLKQALEDYHKDTVGYALGLAEVSKEVCGVVWQKCRDDYEEMIAEECLERYWKYYAGEHVLKMMTLVTISQTAHIFSPWRISFLAKERRCIAMLGIKPLHYPFRLVINFTGYLAAGNKTSKIVIPNVPGSEEHEWMRELKKFRKNVRELCQQAGSETDILAMPSENIDNLRRQAADKRRDIQPLFERISTLSSQLETSKRALAALQIRHTIERLALELDDKIYRNRNTGPRWEQLWKEVWDDATSNKKNPFKELKDGCRGKWDEKNFILKGHQLFADMSIVIHGYDKLGHEYDHFDLFTAEIAKILRPKAVDEDGEVDWKEEVKSRAAPALSGKGMAPARRTGQATGDYTGDTGGLVDFFADHDDLVGHGERAGTEKMSRGGANGAEGHANFGVKSKFSRGRWLYPTLIEDIYMTERHSRI
ncbi:hypothetical protein EG329_005442 [Mollisiaceae sp. DMI_Dod_QoI]|nr:hypothetical protein EG329_005442 [Helotiales sp. DMI_Dod_QoI]